MKATKLVLTLAAIMALAVAAPGPVAGVNLVGPAGAAEAGAPGPLPDTAPQPAPQAQPQEPAAGTDAAWSGEYSMYRPKTHSVQKTDWYCVPASIQMMLNLVNGTRDKSRANQDKYWRYAQDNSRYPITDNGADAQGWALAMRHWGAGNYTVGVHTTMQASLKAAAKRMRTTGKPVGMIVWGRRGGHAWVMTGFRSSADPNATDTYNVTSVQAMGPLYPYGTIGGKSFDPGPRDWVSYSTLQKKFTENVQHNAPAWDGRWITVLP